MEGTTSELHAKEIRDILMRAAIEAARRTPQKPPEPQKPKTTTPIKKEPEIKLKLETDKPIVNEDAIKFLDGVHLDVYDYFNIPPSKVVPEELSRLQRINEWAFKEGTRDRAFQRLIKLETKLGRNYSTESKLNKIYNWVKLNGIASA